MPSHTPASTLADALVLTQEAWVSLRITQEYGLLERSWRLYERLRPLFGRIVLVSYGDGADRAIGEALAPGVRVVCNDRGEEPVRFMADLPARVAAELAGCGSALVKTDQMWGGDAALSIVRALRDAGCRTGLLARGGYHWSWTVAREHGPNSTKAGQAAQIEGELVRHAGAIEVTTPKIAFDLAWRFGLPMDRFIVSPNYVLTDGEVPSMESREPGLILAAGRLAREKRFDMIFEAVSLLPEAVRSRTRVRIVGGGSLEADLMAAAARIGVADRVEFAGRLTHSALLKEMGRCAVYCQPSEYEGHPKTVLESLCMGAPTLVTDAPGLREHVSDGETALVSAGDARSLSAALLRLLTDAALARRLSEQGARATRATLSLDAVFPLEVSACRLAMARAGDAPPPPPIGVRWDQPLLNATPVLAAQSFADSALAFARRLPEGARALFLDALAARLGTEESGAAERPAPRSLQRTV